MIFPSRLDSPLLHAILMSVAMLTMSSPATGQLKYTGVNLAGAEFGASVLPGTYNTHYTYPTASEVNYFVGKGMNTFRLPFRWERLQRTQGGNLNATELSRMDAFVNHATALGANVILDPHNFARYYPDPNDYQSSATGLVGSDVPISAFADFWSKVANHYKSNPRVMFNLMNEPNSMPTEQWVAAANSAISSIRATNARNLILVPGNGWTGAWTWHNNWYGTPNAVAMLDITDPLDNYAFDVHQYLDSDGSGTSQNIVNATIGSQRLSGFTQWLRTHDKRGFLGEWAVARQMVGSNASQIGDEAMLNLMTHVEANDDVWLGWAWWASGPWWGEYMFTLNPTSSGQDRPQMPYLEPHHVGIPVRSCDFNGDASCNVSDLNALLGEGPLASGVPILMSLTDHFDLDGNGVLNTSDVSAWLGEAAQRNGFSSSYRVGDANLDGVVDGSDFGLWNANKFTHALGWDQGDFNADGVIDGTDFGLWNANRFLASDSDRTLVPEPACSVWGLALAALLLKKKCRI